MVIFLPPQDMLKNTPKGQNKNDSASKSSDHCSFCKIKDHLREECCKLKSELAAEAAKQMNKEKSTHCYGEQSSTPR